MIYTVLCGMHGAVEMINGDEQLRLAVKSSTQKRPENTTRLAEVVRQLMDNRISPQQRRFQPIAQLWNYLLPPELRQHCKLADISGGQLKVLVDSPSYMHELRLCSPQLLEDLQTHCPKARIKEIKVAVG